MYYFVPLRLSHHIQFESQSQTWHNIQIFCCGQQIHITMHKTPIFNIKPHGQKKESVPKKGERFKKSTNDTHCAFISNTTESVCACSCLCDSQLFYANSYAEEDHSQKTCLELITPRHATGSALLFRDRPQQKTVYSFKRECVTVKKNYKAQIRVELFLSSYLCLFVSFPLFHSFPSAYPPNSLMQGKYLFMLPELRWMSLIWNCASLSFGMSFQVARNT